MAVDYIPEQFYTGFKDTLGFMTPVTPDDLYLKRQITVDNWRHKDKDTVMIENKPLEGFALADLKRRYSTDNVVWRVTHPEGFDFEISSENFCDLLAHTTIRQGVIEKPLMFVRSGQRNYLTYQGSDLHDKALPLSAVGKKHGVKDLEVGYEVILSSEGESFSYVGKLFYLDKDNIVTRMFTFVQFSELGKITKLHCAKTLPKIACITSSIKALPMWSYKCLVSELISRCDIEYRGNNFTGVFFEKPDLLNMKQVVTEISLPSNQSYSSTGVFLNYFITCTGGKRYQASSIYKNEDDFWCDEIPKHARCAKMKRVYVKQMYLQLYVDNY